MPNLLFSSFFQQFLAIQRSDLQLACVKCEGKWTGTGGRTFDCNLVNLHLLGCAISATIGVCFIALEFFMSVSALGEKFNLL